MTLQQLERERYNEGLEQGLERGLEQGLEQGAELFAVLVSKLMLDNRTDDLKRAAQDKEYRKQLYKEYGL